MRTTLYLLMACLFSACNTIEYIGIETYNPAEITFPKNVDKVLIVNNAVPQPDDVGYTYNLYGTVQDTARAHADSALYDACHSLGKSIVDVSFFNDVLLYHDGTRQDTKYLVDEKLTPEAVKELCRETGTDAVISLDRLLFRMEKDVVAFAEGFVVGGVDIEITGVVRGYLPGRDNPLATVYVQDSVFWSESADNMELLKLYLPSPDEALRAAGQYIGRLLRTLFLIGIMKAVGSIKVKGRVGKKRPPMPCLTNGRKRLHVGSMCMKILHVGKSGQRLHRTWLCFMK